MLNQDEKSGKQPIKKSETDMPKAIRAFKERPISEIYPVIDNDLARDNVENDITAADLQDL